MSFREAVGRLEVLQIYRLLQFIHQKDTEQIKKMVDLGVENLLNLTEPNDGIGALHLAVSANDLDIVSFLLSHGAVPDIQNKKGQTPVMLAAELGNDTIVALLAQNQANMRLLDADGKGVLFYCMYPTKRHTRCLQIALKDKADVNNMSAKGIHVFQLMCEKAKEITLMCLMMLDAGADPTATSQKTGVTALMEAAKVGSLELVRAIIRRGGDVNALDLKRLSAVHYAAMGGFFEVIQALSAYSAEMDVIDLDSCTPLHHAAASGNANCCKFLAQRGCNPKVKNLEGLRPRQIAKDSGHKAAAKELKKAEKIKRESTGVKLMTEVWALTLHDWSNEFETELQQACVDNSDIIDKETFISVLEKLNAPVEPDQLQIVVSSNDEKKEGCINMADFIKGVKYINKAFVLSSYVPKKKKEGKAKKGGKKKGKLEIPVPILTMPLESMPRRPDGGPPHFMIEKYHKRSGIQSFDPHQPPEHPLVDDARWYIDKPNKVYVSINDCVTGGDFASLELAFRQGVPVDVKDPFYKTPLMAACFSGNYEMAQYLINQGADINMSDQLLWTPLHHAAYRGETLIVELLVATMASVDAGALDGSTPLMFAIQMSKTSCVEVLIKAGARVYAENKREQNCLEIALEVGDYSVTKLVKDKMDSLPKPKDAPKEKNNKDSKKSKPAQKKVVAADGAETLTATSGKTPSQMDSKSVILQYTSITTGKTNAVNITFVPEKTLVQGKLPSTSQLLSKTERRKELLALKEEFNDSLIPFSHNIQKKILELTKTKTQSGGGSARDRHIPISVT